MAKIEQEIAAFRRMQADLESRALGKWVLVHDEQVVDLFDSFEGAAEHAVRRFGRGPYLIRQIGTPPVTLPASAMYHPTYAQD
jgi:hypothetical protein